jgi:hypothetical protein
MVEYTTDVKLDYIFGTRVVHLLFVRAKYSITLGPSSVKNFWKKIAHSFWKIGQSW